MFLFFIGVAGAHVVACYSCMILIILTPEKKKTFFLVQMKISNYKSKWEVLRGKLFEAYNEPVMVSAELYTPL